MNESCTVQEQTAEPARSVMLAGTQVGGTPSTQQSQQEGGNISSAEIAQKVMKLTGNVRLVSRSAHHWHHCGINE